MINQDLIKDIKRIPVRGYSYLILDDDRIRTDLFCLICNSIFVILLFIVSLAVFNNCNRQLIKIN